MTESCQFCGARLAVGAVACFRCGKMVERAGADGTTGGGALPTQLGTQAKGQLLEGQWRLVKPIGQGAIGVVWQAQDVGLDRAVAVKLMHERLVTDAVATARFERESRVLATLEHPHVVPILGVGKHGQQPFLVMKLLEGRSLAELIHTRGGRLPASEAVPVLSKLCEALDFVHGKGVLHRDLKPSNVFVGNEGQVWLLDLGLAHEAGSELTRTNSAELLGSVAYLAPEVLQGRRDADRRADVFSLGCLAFEAFVGEPPFTGEVRDVLAHQMHTLPPDANTLAPQLPAGVGALLRKAMAKISLERPKSAGDFAQELQRLCGIAADGTASRGPGSSAPLIMPVRRPSREVPAASAPRRPSREVPAAREPTTDPREAVTAPSDPAVAAVPEPQLGARDTSLRRNALQKPLQEETTLAGRALPLRGPLEEEPTAIGSVRAAREGPTGPTKQQRAQALRRAFIGLSVVAVVTLLVVVLAFATGSPQGPEMPMPLPPSARPVESVAMVKPAVPENVEKRPPADYALPEPPKPPAVVLVDPGQETYKPLDYNRFKRVKAKHIEIRGGSLGAGPPIIEIRVFGPNGLGRDLNADVLFDGVRKGTSPVKVKTTAGQHFVQVSREPYPNTELELTVEPGSRRTVDIELQPPGAEGWAKESTAEPPVKGEKQSRR